jgi:hypothetical protein
MSHRCGACNGTGDCKDDHHNIYDQIIGGSIETVSGFEGDPCPSCGNPPQSPGKCSVCGGSGEQDD